MNPNRKLARGLFVVVMVTLVSTAMPVPATARDAAAPVPTQALPPIPEWPIIGPVLQWLGVASVEKETPVPTAGLSEYRISDFEDAQALAEIPTGERVRIIASETDLNDMIRRTIEDNVNGNASLVLDFELNLLNLVVRADESLLEAAADSLPRQIRGDMDLSGSFDLEASACAMRVDVKKIQLNGWSFGLRPLAQRAINQRIPDLWPDEICVERVLLMQNEAAVEGYRR